MRKYHFFYILIVTVLIFAVNSCKKFVQVPPPKTGLVDATVFSNAASVRGALSRIYADMSSDGNSFAGGSIGSISLLGGLSSDELTDYTFSGDYSAIYQNNIVPQNGYPTISVWDNPYNYIYRCNDIINGTTTSTSISSADKMSLIAEAKFVRAFCYFYLVNFYGDIPLHLTTDYRQNQSGERTAKDKVYIQIVTDLKEAVDSLPLPTVPDTRIFPNSDVAAALLARVYLYTGQYALAINNASKLIKNTSRYQLCSDLDSVFLNNSKEAIWQLQPVTPGSNTQDAQTFILQTTPTLTALSDQLLNAFEPQDNRKQNWVGIYDDGESKYYYPFKYKILSSTSIQECSMVVRLGELYLIRSEAYANTDQLDLATADLNKIRNRAGLQNTAAVGKIELLAAISHERQVELFTEWGHRWLDLKRTGTANAVLGPIKPTWKPTAMLYPIPQEEINANNKIAQNPGYGE